MMGGRLGWEQDMAQQSSGGTRIQVRENGQYKIIPSPIHTRTHQQRNTTRTSCETLSREKDAESRSRETITHPIHPRFKQKSKNWTNPQKKNRPSHRNDFAVAYILWSIRLPIHWRNVNTTRSHTMNCHGSEWTKKLRLFRHLRAHPPGQCVCWRWQLLFGVRELENGKFYSIFKIRR